MVLYLEVWITSFFLNEFLTIILLHATTSRQLIYYFILNVPENRATTLIVNIQTLSRTVKSLRELLPFNFCIFFLMLMIE